MVSNAILDAIISEKHTLSSYGVSRIGLFGSASRDELTDSSDIDVLVEFTKGNKTYRNLYNTSELLEKLFSRPVDVVTSQSISPYIKPHILKDIRYVEIAN